MLDNVYYIDFDKFNCDIPKTPFNFRFCFQLQEENADLTEKIEKVVKELEEMKKSNTVLQQNISKLYNTAKAEFERRTRMIKELQQKVDDLTFRRIPKRKPEEKIDSGNEQPAPKKPRVDENEKYSVLKDNYAYDKKPDRGLRRERNSSYSYRRSRSRSRERRRKTPPRESYRRYDRSNVRRYSPEVKYDRNYTSKQPLKPEPKKPFELIKVKGSDSDSVVSINSNESEDDFKKVKTDKDNQKKNEKSRNVNEKSKNVEAIVTQLKLNKTRNSSESNKVTKNDVKNKEEVINIDYEVEEGELSDDSENKSLTDLRSKIMEEKTVKQIKNMEIHIESKSRTEKTSRDSEHKDNTNTKGESINDKVTIKKTENKSADRKSSSRYNEKNAEHSNSTSKKSETTKSSDSHLKENIASKERKKEDLHHIKTSENKSTRKESGSRRLSSDKKIFEGSDTKIVQDVSNSTTKEGTASVLKENVSSKGIKRKESHDTKKSVNEKQPTGSKTNEKVTSDPKYSKNKTEDNTNASLSDLKENASSNKNKKEESRDTKTPKAKLPTKKESDNKTSICDDKELPCSDSSNLNDSMMSLLQKSEELRKEINKIDESNNKSITENVSNVEVGKPDENKSISADQSPQTYRATIGNAALILGTQNVLSSKPSDAQARRRRRCIITME